MLMASLIARLIEQEYEALADEMLSAGTPSSVLAGSAYAGGANSGSGSANGGTPFPNGCNQGGNQGGTPFPNGGNCHGTPFATPLTSGVVSGTSVATMPSASLLFAS
jgi:hypothetical protein